MRAPTTLSFALLAAGCVSAPRPAPPPAPLVVLPASPLPRAPVAADWRDWPVTAGTWRYSQDERGSIARFDAAGAGLAALRCDRQGGRVFLSGVGATTGPMTVRTSSVTRVVQTGVTGGNSPFVAATLAPNDPLLDAITFSRGRFVLSREGNWAPLVLPAWAEVARVVEDCRL